MHYHQTKSGYHMTGRHSHALVPKHAFRCQENQMDQVKEGTPPYDDLAVYNCPFCGDYMIDPKPESEAHAQLRLNYRNWHFVGEPKHIDGTPCWHCDPINAANSWLNSAYENWLNTPF